MVKGVGGGEVIIGEFTGENVGEVTFDEGEALVGESTFGELKVGEVIFGELKVGEVIFGEALIGETILGSFNFVGMTLVAFAVFFGEFIFGELFLGAFLDEAELFGEDSTEGPFDCKIGECVSGIRVSD